MRFRIRVWMPLVGVLIVLFSITAMLIYVLPTVKSRLADYSEGHSLELALAASEAVADKTAQQRLRSLDAAAAQVNGQVLLVARDGKILGHAGPDLLDPNTGLLRAIASKTRAMKKSGKLRIAKVPVFYQGNPVGGVIVVYEGTGDPAYRLFLRSGLEAAALAAILGGGLMLFLGTLLSRRIERLNAGASSIKEGNLSHRLPPGYDDELGELSRTLNSMAASLKTSFDRLETNKKTLHAILDNLNEGIIATNLQGEVMFMNPSVARMLGLNDKEGKKVPDLFDDFSLPKAVTRCAEEQECAEAHVRSGESFLWINLEHMPAFDDHRGGVLVVVRDLSEGRRLETNQQRFLTDAAHELRTPITTIRGAAELLLTEEDDDPETRRRFLDHILSESQRMQRLADTLLELARVGWDQREPDLRPLSLKTVAEAAARRVNPISESAGLTLAIEGRGSRVLADQALLEQALLVLLNNAVKHSRRHGEVRLLLRGNTIAVEDEGAGINAEELPHVFERFYKGNEGSGGFGLGLHICRELVERMGGEVSIRSEEGVGTAVEISLPEV